LGEGGNRRSKNNGRKNMPGGTSRRGFASMDPAKQREIASKGGSSVPPEKRPFSQDHKLAADAGRRGGEQSRGPRGGPRGVADQRRPLAPEVGGGPRSEG
jgi:general stress protein YciG